MKVVIVGGVAGGASAAARLRRLDEEAEIILLERGEYISYANCGLPYHISGEIPHESSLTLQTPGSFRARFQVDVRTCHEAVAVHRERKTVTVHNRNSGGNYEESYDKLILSPGAEPLVPPLGDVEDPRVFTLRTIPDTLRIKEYAGVHRPQGAVVIGGGYIGLEMAENLSLLGIKVTLVELGDHILAPFDREMAALLHHHLRSKGVSLRLGRGVKRLEAGENGVAVTLDSGERLPAGMVILAVGVRPESGLAKEAGLALGVRGTIAADDRMQTSDPDIYAVGDAVEVENFLTGQKAHIPLAGPANKQGRIAADQICGINSRYKGTQGSAILKLFEMTAAATGLNERLAKAAGLEVDKVYTLSSSHAGYYPGASEISLKLVFEKGSGKILGGQMVGADGVDKRCDVLATAIRAGMTVRDLTELELCYAPPYSSAKDPVNMAGFVAENLLDGRVKQFYLEDVEGLISEGAQLLDVRTDREYAWSHFPGAKLIPVDSLRERLGELDPSKPVYVNCRSGLRSYLACRILSQKGFDCYNLAGGYALYHAVISDLEAGK